MMRRVFCALALLGLVESEGRAEDSPDKSSYNLFRPVPDSMLREMETDRPDKTESAYTVDAGHFQVELDLLAYTYDRSSHETLKALAVAATNFKAGILNNVDLQIIVETYNTQRIEDRSTGRNSCLAGFGDVTLRSKINLWGNDGGPTAFSVMPFLKIPTAKTGLGNGATEGGVIFPFAMELPGKWDLGTQVEVDQFRDSARSNYHQEFSHTVTVGHDIVGKLAGYLELYNNVSNESHSSWIATFDFGFTYAVRRDVRLDAGMNIGLTDAAEDWNPFVGLSVRY